MKLELFSPKICTSCQHAIWFPFKVLNAILNHVDAITIKRLNGPICETESHKQLGLCFTSNMTLLRVKCGCAKYPCVRFQRKRRCRNVKRTHLKNGNTCCPLHAF